MLLRYHPLLQYHDVRNWPPAWSLIDGPENKPPRREIGILRQVVPSKILPVKACFLYIDYEGSAYIGCLLFDDSAFCNQIIKLLQGAVIVPLRKSVAWISRIRSNIRL
jgi:hypothetical protein